MSFFQDAAGEAKKIPWWGWILGGGAVLLVGSHLLGKQGASTTSDTTGDMGTPGPTDTGDGTGSDGFVGPPEKLPPPPPGSTPPPGKKPPPKERTYTVRSGDTLYAIAAAQHVDEQNLFHTNQSMLDSVARSHGFASSDNGHWIFPGEVLKIPA